MYNEQIENLINMALADGELTEKEMGYVSLTELEELKLPMGLKIERDRYTKVNDKTLEELL